MYLYVRGINCPLCFCDFYWILELFRQCDIFFHLVSKKRIKLDTSDTILPLWYLQTFLSKGTTLYCFLTYLEMYSFYIMILKYGSLQIFSHTQKRRYLI